MKKNLTIGITLGAIFTLALGLMMGAGTTVNGTRTINGDLTVKGTCTGCGGAVSSVNGQTGAVIGSGSAIVLIEQHACSGASCNFTTCFTSTYDDYRLELLNMVPATNGDALRILVSTDGGMNYDIGNNYGWLRWGFQAGGASANGGDSTAFMQVGLSTISSTVSNGGLSGSLQWANPLNASGQKYYVGLIALQNTTASNARTAETISGWYNSNTAVNAFQLKMSSGTITSGTGRCYGIVKT